MSRTYRHMLRNRYAKAVRTPRYKMRVIKNKKTYNRKRLKRTDNID